MTPEKGLQLEGLVERLMKAARDYATEIGGFPPSDTIFAEAAQAITTLEAELAETRDEEPIEPGAFEGDIFFGDRTHTARGTHRWTSGAWERLPSDEEVLMDLLGKARLRANTAEAALQASEARVKELEGVLGKVQAVVDDHDLDMVQALLDIGELAQAALTSGGEGLSSSVAESALTVHAASTGSAEVDGGAS